MYDKKISGIGEFYETKQLSEKEGEKTHFSHTVIGDYLFFRFAIGSLISPRSNFSPSEIVL